MAETASLLAVGGAALLALGALAATHRSLLTTGLVAQAAGILAIGLSGTAVLVDETRIGSGFRNEFGFALGVDPLSGFFLATLAVVAVPTLAYARGYLRGADADAHVPAIASLTGGFLLSMVLVLTARDATSFLAGWELMTLLPATAILVARRDAPVVRAVFVYLATTHLGGAGVWVAVLAAAHYGALTDPGALAAAGSGIQAVVGLSAVIGFGTKAGLMPLHTWLPRAHPVAPSHISALMSGLMVKVALYGLIRVLFEWIGTTPRWLALVVLALGLMSALAGVLYALVQPDLKRLLAFSSIENVGIVTLGLGASLLFSSAGRHNWAAFAFAAALLHSLCHAVFKALLFLAAGAFERAVGSLELDRLGGLLRRMPWTGGAFLVGSLAIAGVPPLGGFASEWLTLQALLHLGLQGPVGIGVAAALAAAGLAAVAALALYCFVKAAGLVLLGAARRPETENAREVSTGMRAGMAVLAAGCVVLGAVPGLILPILLELAPVPATAQTDVTVAAPATGGLPALWLLIALPILTGVIWMLRGSRRSATAPAWACGQLNEPALRWTSASFTKPLRLVLDSVLRPRREVRVDRADGVLRSITYDSRVPHLFDTWLYEPVHRRMLTVAAFARRLQSGSVRTYAGYLLALVLLALVLARTGVLG